MDSGEEDEPKAKPRKRLIKKSNKEIQENEDFSAGKLRGKEGSSNKIKPKEERVQKVKNLELGLFLHFLESVFGDKLLSILQS
ncbi:hypothetical protein AMTRI_Chr04g252990 [Amborella trichopoda]